MEIHHDKHHQAYVDKVNAALEGTECADKPIEDVLANLAAIPDDKRNAVRNNGGGHYNHSLFWESMSARRRRRARRRARRRDRRRVRLVRRLPGEGQGDRRQPVRLRLVVAGPRRLGPGGRRLGQPGQPALRRQDAAAGRRRLGARLLPEVPEPPPRLPRRVVEHGRLGQGRGALRGGVRRVSATRPLPSGFFTGAAPAPPPLYVLMPRVFAPFRSPLVAARARPRWRSRPLRRRPRARSRSSRTTSRCCSRARRLRESLADRDRVARRRHDPLARVLEHASRRRRTSSCAPRASTRATRRAYPAASWDALDDLVRGTNVRGLQRAALPQLADSRLGVGLQDARASSRARAAGPTRRSSSAS